VRNSEETYSRNTDAHDVPLDGEVVRRITGRFLDRAERVAGDRGRGYLSERIDSLIDRWEEARTGTTRLGYRQGSFHRQRLRGLLHSATGGRWSELTVAQSMRETENEVNLLIPGSGLFDQTLGQPPWSFGPPDKGDQAEAGSGGPGGGGGSGGEADDIPVADELGESVLDAEGGMR
jgi:hypothetical protein